MIRTRQTMRMVQAMMLLTLALGVGGCLAAAGAGVGAKFATGNEKGPVQASPERTAEAAKAVLEENGFSIVEDRVEADGQIEIEGENPDGRKARLKIDPVADASTLSVRVGLLGDRDTAEVYFERIKKRAEQ